MTGRKVRVLQIIKSLGRGGAEMLLPETLKVHNKQLFEFHYIYFLPHKNALVEEIRKQGAPIVCIPAVNNIQILLRVNAVAKYIKRNNIQLIHAHLPWAGILSRLVGRKTGIPVVYTEHNKQERYHWITRFFNLASMNLLRMIIAVSEDVEISIRKFKPDLRIPARVVVNGVNTEHFVPGKFDANTVRGLFNIPPGSKIIGVVAVFRVQKRLDVWIDIAKHILSALPDTHFILVGDGPLREQLILKRKELCLESNVHFAGAQTEVRPYLSAFDLFMMTSIFEGMPLAVLEAMSSGCPVISTAAGGIKEIVRHDKDGLICPVDQPGRLAEFACELLLNDEKRADFSRNCRQRVLNDFSLTKMVAEIEACYGEIV